MSKRQTDLRVAPVIPFMDDVRPPMKELSPASKGALAKCKRSEGDGLIGTPADKALFEQSHARLDSSQRQRFFSEFEEWRTQTQPSAPPPQIETSAVVASLLNYKKSVAGIKVSSMKTYEKRYPLIIRYFPYLPTSLDPVFEFLDQFKGETGRYRLEYFRYLKEIFQHAVRVFGLPRNPLEGIKSPSIKHKPIRTLRLDQFAQVNLTPKDLMERLAWELLGGHGWRQVEVRRVTARDVRA